MSGLKAEIFYIKSDYFTHNAKNTKYELKNDEIIIRLHKYPLLKDYINKTLTFSYKGKIISLILKDIISE